MIRLAADPPWLTAISAPSAPAAPAAPPSAAPVPDAAFVEGTVFGVDGRPDSRARVDGCGGQASADGQGRFRLEGVPGPCSLVALRTAIEQVAVSLDGGPTHHVAPEHRRAVLRDVFLESDPNRFPAFAVMLFAASLMAGIGLSEDPWPWEEPWPWVGIARSTPRW